MSPPASSESDAGRERTSESERVCVCVKECESVVFFLALQHQHTQATINFLEKKKLKTSPQGREGKYQIRKEGVKVRRAFFLKAVEF